LQESTSRKLPQDMSKSENFEGTVVFPTEKEVDERTRQQVLRSNPSVINKGTIFDISFSNGNNYRFEITNATDVYNAESRQSDDTVKLIHHNGRWKLEAKTGWGLFPSKFQRDYAAYKDNAAITFVQ
jgi:hypothetical protein